MTVTTTTSTTVAKAVIPEIHTEERTTLEVTAIKSSEIHIKLNLQGLAVDATKQHTVKRMTSRPASACTDTPPPSLEDSMIKSDKK